MTRHILAAVSAAATLAGILLRALADGCERVSDSLIAQQTVVPDCLPDCIDEEAW